MKSLAFEKTKFKRERGDILEAKRKEKDGKKKGELEKVVEEEKLKTMKTKA